MNHICAPAWNRGRRLIHLMFGVMAVAAMGGCSEGETTALEGAQMGLEAVGRVTITPRDGTVGIGQTLQLAVTVTDRGGTELTGRTVTWSTSKPNIATVDNKGVVTGVSEGRVMVVADVEGRTGIGFVTVTPGPAPTELQVTITPAQATVQTGGTMQLLASVTDGQGAVVTRPITWSSSNGSVASVSTSGLVQGVAAGTAVITAATDGASATATITVTAPQTVVASVTVTPSTASLLVGGTVQLTAVARDGSGNIVANQTISWTTSNAGAATVNGSGVVTGVAAGTTTITASAAGVSGNAAVTVTAPAPVPPTVSSVTLTPSSATLETGGTVQLVATARDGSGNVMSGQTFTWSSSNTGVASVSASGVVTGVSAGTATIRATTGGVTGNASVTVNAPAPPTEPPPSNPNVLFFSDWRTARGNTLDAVSDGGKWNIQSRSFDRTMNIVSSTGLDFPSANVYQVIGVADMEGWSMLRKTGMPIPAVGESRFYRWYIRVTMPDNLEDYNTHPIQDGVAGSQTNWMFLVINSSNSPSGNVPAGQWMPQFWATSAPWPYQRWYGPNLNKNQTYRFELQVHRVSSTQFQMHVRIYDSAGGLVASDGNFQNYGTSTLATNPTFPLTSPLTMDGLNAGNNGIAGSAPWPFTISYQGAFAVCASSWCGPYNGNY